MPGLIELLAIFVIGTTVAYAVASKLAGSRLGEVYAFIIQLGGAYAASFVVDMFRMVIWGEIAFDQIAIPQATWTVIVVISYLVARRVGASAIAVAAPYTAIAFVAAFAGMVHIGNIAVAAVMLLLSALIYRSVVNTPEITGRPLGHFGRQVLNHAMTQAAGGVIAFGIAKLVGLVFPAATPWVFAITWGWWLWIGWRYAKQQDARRLRY